MTLRRSLCAFCALIFLFSSQLDAQTRKSSRKSTRSDAASASKTRQPVRGAQELQPTKLDAFKQFKSENPNARFYGSQFYQATSEGDEAGGVTSVYGTILSVGATAQDSAESHINDIRGMLGTEIGRLVPDITPDGEIARGVMFNKSTNSHRFQILRYNQAVGDVPVFRSGVGFLVRNEPGNPLVMSGINVKDLTGAVIASPAGRPTVTAGMLRNVGRVFGAVPVERSVLKTRSKAKPIVPTEEEYVIFAGVNGEFATPELAIQFTAEQGSVVDYPEYHKSLVLTSVATGEVLYSETMVCSCAECLVDVQGTVSGRATEGLATLECDPEVAKPLPYAEVEVVGGNTTFADSAGQFTIANGGSGAVQVRSYLRGEFFEVFDQAAGNSTPFLTQTVTPPGPAGFLHNPTTTDDEMTANVNAYVEANVVRDYVLSYVPNFPTIDTQTGFDINTNINANCNATYNGSSINFYTAGGGCNNTAAADVIYHEYGHHLINRTGNGQGQMGEGSGDCVGVLIQDDPVLGNGFQQNCGAGIRNADNNLQYPCSGAIHTCGQLISGCVWSLRNELIQTEPSSYRDIGAELFLNMLVVRGQMFPGSSTIGPEITLIYLELDDDDADVGNGTPHFFEIANAFGSHNMNVPTLMSFAFPNGHPEFVSPQGGTVLNVQVNQGLSIPAAGSGMFHVDIGDGNGFQTLPMTETSDNNYEAVFPASDCLSTIRYYFSADTVFGYTVSNPVSAPLEYFELLSASAIEDVMVEDFESVSGWTISGDALDGQWELGDPVGGGVRGDPADDADGSGQCYLTDNESGNSDVDDGSTILTSGILDASVTGESVAVISYKRWYSNDFGNAPEQNIFVVEISNDGGSTWVNLETVGPTGAEVRGGWIQASHRVSDFVAPTNQMRLRFTAADVPGSVVEAGVDDLRIRHIICENPVPILATKRLTGSAVGGGFADLSASDDSDLQMEPAATDNPFKQRIDMIVLAESPTINPTEFSLRVEASMSGGPVGDVVQSIELYDRIAGVWVEVDSRAASDSDEVVTVSPTGDLSRFVKQSTTEILGRVIYSSTDFSDSPFDWSVDIDQIEFLIE